MSTDPAVQRAVDNEHLKLLSIFYYVLGAMNALGAFAMLIYVLMGGFFVGIPLVSREEEAAPMAFVGVILIVIGLVAFVLVALFAGLKLYAGYCIAQRKKRIFCYVVAALCCLNIPFGALLGIFTFIVLSRPSVTAQFNQTTAEVVE